MESRGDQFRAFMWALLLHTGLLGLIWFSAAWVWKQPARSAAGQPIQATLEVSAADIRRAQQAIKSSPAQSRPQAPQERPDTISQPAVDRNALLPAEPQAHEQEQRTQQNQVDLTQDIVRQQDAERQRLQDQLNEVKQQREAATKRTLMEEQRLKQLADLQRDSLKLPVLTRNDTPGNQGQDDGLSARYSAALNATARANWNTSAVPEATICNVHFWQIPGGEVIKVEFTDCPYDAQGRDSVERALLKTPMPYSGFEAVFQREVTLKMCYPEEACQR